MFLRCHMYHQKLHFHLWSWWAWCVDVSSFPIHSFEMYFVGLNSITGLIKVQAFCHRTEFWIAPPRHTRRDCRLSWDFLSFAKVRNKHCLCEVLSFFVFSCVVSENIYWAQASDTEFEQCWPLTPRKNAAILRSQSWARLWRRRTPDEHRSFQAI